MEDLGFNGSGSHFNSRFESGAPIHAKQLNDLAAGIQASLPMPYLGEGAAVSFTPGGSIITTSQRNVNSVTPSTPYYEQFQCSINYMAEEEEWRLKIVKGWVVYANDKQPTQVEIENVTPGSPVTVVVVEGEDPHSIYTNNGGYCILDEDVSWGVYLIHIKVTETDKHFTYLYVADHNIYGYPSTNFVAYGVDDTPPGLDTPETAYTMSVVQIAAIDWDTTERKFTLQQELIGPPTFPTVIPPIQFTVDVINREKDIAAEPDWMLRVAKGSVLSSGVEGGCIGHEWVNEISPEVNPVIGDYEDSPYTNRGGGLNIDRNFDYDVYLFRVKEEAGEGYNYILWAGPTADYTDQCPVELPEDIRPPGEYEAQSVHIAFVEQKDLTSNTWVVNQIVQGTITFPDAPSNKCKHPFEVKRNGVAESIVWSVCEGSVNNVLPDPPFDTFTMTDGYVWLRVEYGNGMFPINAPENSGIIVQHGPTVPADTDEYGHIVIASITDDVVTQLVTGSLWGNRIKLGSNVARYFWARI